MKKEEKEKKMKALVDKIVQAQAETLALMKELRYHPRMNALKRLSGLLKMGLKAKLVTAIPKLEIIG